MAANTQLGQTNNQTLGVSSDSSVSVKESENVKVSQDKQEVKADKVETVTVNKDSPLMFGFLLGLFIMWSYLLWKLPSPNQIWRK